MNTEKFGFTISGRDITVLRKEAIRCIQARWMVTSMDYTLDHQNIQPAYLNFRSSANDSTSPLVVESSRPY